MQQDPNSKQSFRTQMAWLFGAVVVIVCAAVTGLSAWRWTQQIKTDRGAALSVMARSVAISLGDGMRERSRQVSVLADSDELWDRGIDSQQVREALARTRASRANAAWIGVADVAGVVRGATDGLLLGQSVAQRPWFQEGLRGEHIGDVHSALLLASLLPRAQSGEPQRFVDFSAPIKVEGRVVGVIGMHGSWDWATGVVNSVRSADAALDDVQVFIQSKDGTLLYRPKETAKLDDSKQYAELTALPIGRDQASQWPDGGSYLTSVAAVPEVGVGAPLGWRVLVREPVERAYAPARAALARSAALGVVVAAAAALLAWWAAGVVSSPLVEMASAAQKVRQGTRFVRMPVFNGNREVQSLSQSLNAMTETLLQSNESLEQRVAQRTSELVVLAAEQGAMLDNEVVAICRVRNRRIVWSNRAFDNLFGYAGDDLKDAPTRILHPDDDSYEKFGREAQHDLAASGRFRSQLHVVRKDGSLLWVDAGGTQLSEQVHESLWVMNDITALKEKQEQAEHIAFHDNLTGLPNRLLLQDRLRQAMVLDVRLNRHLALCFVDLDGFKAVNDVHGHHAGDILLAEVARRLLRCVRGNDTVARVGGDEFVLLLTPLHDPHECSRVLQRVMAALEPPIEVDADTSAVISASIGVAYYPADGAEASDLIRRADDAMYQAKRAGRRRIHVYGQGELLTAKPEPAKP